MLRNMIFLTLFLMLLTNTVSADTIIVDGIGGNSWNDSNISLNNVVENLGDGKIQSGIKADNWNDGNESWTDTTSGGWSVISGSMYYDARYDSGNGYATIDGIHTNSDVLIKAWTETETNQYNLVGLVSRYTNTSSRAFAYLHDYPDEWHMSNASSIAFSNFGNGEANEHYIRMLTNETTLKAKAWKLTDSEPDVWQINTSILDSSLTSGKLGIITTRVTVYFDDFWARSVNSDGTINTNSNISRNYTSSIGVDEELKTMKWIGESTLNTIDVYGSTDGVSYTLKQFNVSSNESIDVSGNGYKYGIWEYNISHTNSTVYISNITSTIGTSISPPSISNTNIVNTSYENTDQLFTLDIDQTVNVSWKINGTEYQTNISVTSASYINSTALNGSYNVTAIASNANGTDSHTWIMTRLLPTWDYIVINSTQTLIWFSLSNYTEGVQINSVTWGNRIGTTGNTSTLYYQNGTSITSNSTYVDGNVTLIPPELLEERTYYIEETVTTTIETFVVAAGAFAAVVVAGAAVVSRRVRVGIGGWLNRRRRRR